MKSSQILKTSSNLVSEDRHKKYGDKLINHQNIANLWTAYVHNKNCKLVFKPKDVAIMMALLKIARTQAGEDNDDNYIDACGYMGIAGELMNRTKD